MAKITLTDLTNLSNETSVVNAINNNNAAIEAAIENTLSRDGTTPNEMESNLDMNNFRILNLPSPLTDQEPVRKQDLGSLTAGGVSDHGLLTGLADNDHPQYALVTTIRERLTGPRTYYVRTDGSDSNTGLANTAGGAFLTIQKAIDVAAGLDSSIYDVTIQIAAGTYALGTGLVGKNMVGAGQIILLGDETTPANVVLSTSGAMTGLVGNLCCSALYTRYNVRGVKLTSTGTGSMYALNAKSGAKIDFQNVDFGGTFTGHTRADDTAVITATGNYTISGSSGAHHSCVGGAVIRVQSRTITLTGTPNFSSVFADFVRVGIGFLNGNVYSGSATGVRYNVSENSAVTVAGAGANYFPGNSAGATATGGQYN